MTGATTAPGLMRRADPELVDFAQLVGSEGPVCPVGGRTQWGVGGPPDPGSREVAAPAGVVAHLPKEMIVRVRAGTSLAALAAALTGGGQMVPFDLPDPSAATVGGVLAVGHSGPRRIRYGPLRDTVLEVRFVNSAGRLVTAGGPVVKNVTGFDLCRLLVGSLGTLGVLAEVVLRCHPIPAASRWFQSAAGDGAADPLGLSRRLYRPSSILWDGASVWVLLEGHPDDIADQAAGVLGAGFAEVADGPELQGLERLSLRPEQLSQLPHVPLPPHVAQVPHFPHFPTGRGWLAEIGVGTVHTPDAASLAGALGLVWPPTVQPRVAQLHRALKQRFDPTGRLNPGRRVG